jgi:hypothetical protein
MCDENGFAWILSYALPRGNLLRYTTCSKNVIFLVLSWFVFNTALFAGVDISIPFQPIVNAVQSLARRSNKDKERNRRQQKDIKKA